MNANTKKLHDLGQSLWVDHISREMLMTGRLARHGESAEKLFFALALEDLTTAADPLRPIFHATDGLDGWVSLEVSPLLAENAASTIHAAAWLHAAADRLNLFIKIPGTAAGIEAIKESIFGGVPVDVTLLFSREQYLAAAEAYLRGIERRIEAGLDPNVRSVASLFGSRWDASVPELSGYRDRDAYLQGLSRSARLAALAEASRSGCATAAAAVGQHRHQGRGGARHAVRRGTGSARHHQHDAREDTTGVRRPRRGRSRVASRWGRRRGTGLAPAARRCRCLCKIMAGATGRTLLVDVPRLVSAYYTGMPDPAVPSQRVAFGTSGHRGSSFEPSFNDGHVLAITQAICEYRQRRRCDAGIERRIDADTGCLARDPRAQPGAKLGAG